MTKQAGGWYNPQVDRRTFLKVGASLAAVSAVVPSLPSFERAPVPMVTGDNAPDPTPLDQGVKVINSVCQQCHGRCGIAARVKDGVLIKLDGNPYHPNNMDPDEMLPYSSDPAEAIKTPGHLCLKGLSGNQVVYDPYRVKQPLKRVGPRGSGNWQAVTWEVALKDIAARLKELRDLNTPVIAEAPELGPLANQVVYAPGRTVEGDFTDRIWSKGFGTVNKKEDHTSICEVSHHVGNELITWDEAAKKGRKNHFKPDLLNSKYVVLFGANYLEANFPMVALGRKLMEMKKRGGKYVVVDPRFSNSAALANRWVPVKPGTDAALALGMARWMVDNGKYDSKFLVNANKEAATANKEKSWTDATWLVVTDPKDADSRKYLRADAIGGSKENTVVWDGSKAVEVKGGTPIQGVLNTGEVSVGGKTCKAVFTLLTERLQEKTIGEYAEIAGVSAEIVTTLATEFAAAGKKAVANTYRGAVQHTNGVYNQLAAMVLNTLAGNYDWKGGNTIGGGSWGYTTGVVDVTKVPGGVSTKGVRINRVGKAYEKDAPSVFKRDGGYPAKRPWFPYGTHGNYQEVIPSAADGYPYPIKALITYWNAWPYSTPALRSVFEEYAKDEKKLPLFVAISINIGEVAALADYILPDTTYLEKWAFPGMTPTILTKATSFQQPVVGKLDGKTIGGPDFVFDPDAPNRYAPVLPNTKSMIDIHIELAKLMGLPGVGENAFEDGGSLNSAWDWVKRSLQNLSKASGKTVKEIIAKGGVFEDPGNEYAGDYLKYPYGNVVHLYIEQLATTKDSMTGEFFDGLPKYEPIKHTDDKVLDDPDYPFQLVTYKSVRHAQARTAALPWLMVLNPENSVDLSAADAKKIGVETGNLVRISSPSQPRGIVGRALVTEGLRPGVVAVSHSYGHWELGSKPHQIDGQASGFDPSRGAGIQANEIMRLDERLKNVSLQDKIGCSVSFNDTRIKVEKL